MDLRVFARSAAVLVVGSALIAAIQAVARLDRDGGSPTAVRTSVNGDSEHDRDPNGDRGDEASALQHCNDLGLAAESDATCKSVWLANRTRFLGVKSWTAPATADHGEGAP
jgi:conjugative transfer region protein TrbK